MIHGFIKSSKYKNKDYTFCKTNSSKLVSKQKTKKYTLKTSKFLLTFYFQT